MYTVRFPDRVYKGLDGCRLTRPRGELANAVRAEELGVKIRFLEYSREGGAMARELQSEVRRLGGHPEKSGGMSGSLHRGWLDIKNALKESLSARVQTIVQQHAAKVRVVHDAVRNLRDRAKVAH